MKKLIAIAVVFALVAGAAFAETSVSGNITARGKLIDDKIDDNDDTKAQTSGEIETGYIQLSGQNDEGTFGGLIRLRGNDAVGKFHRAFVWWQPIPQLRIFYGQDPDGKFGPYNVWSFFQGQEGYAHNFQSAGLESWGNWRASFPGNWDTFGLSFSVFPVQGVEANLVVPASGGVGKQGSPALASWEGFYTNKSLEDVWLGSLELATSFSIPDIGKAGFTVIGPGTNIFDENYKGNGKNAGNLGLWFLLTAVDSLDVQLGGAFTLPGKEDENDYPLNLALIANYNAGDFGLNFRTRFVLGTGDDKQFATEINVQPSYKLAFMKIFLAIGFYVSDNDTSDDNDALAAVFVNPYVRVPLGPGEIRIGLHIEDPNLDSESDKDATVKVPVMFTYSF
jgi:hypothetical protein